MLDYVIFSSVWSGKHLTKGKKIVKIIKSWIFIPLHHLTEVVVSKNSVPLHPKGPRNIINNIVHFYSASVIFFFFWQCKPLLVIWTSLGRLCITNLRWSSDIEDSWNIRSDLSPVSSLINTFNVLPCRSLKALKQQGTKFSDSSISASFACSQ